MTQARLVFDPREHALPGNCTDYAQAPQVLLVEDRIRVFFSTRERDQTGKFLSQITYADFTKSFELLSVAPTVAAVELGDLGG